MSFNCNKLLILDLDETLIHSTEKELARPRDLRIDEYNVYKRPNVDDFMVNCAEIFDLAVWTAASRDYAKEIIELIIPKSIELKFIFTGDRCTRRYDYDLMEAYYIKPLKKVKRRGYSLEKVLIIDDSPENFEKNYGNGIQVKRYFGEKEDNELILLLKYLKQIATVENVRTIDKRGWRDRV
ncbi:MAG: NIF family HAD-type phosphatase [Prochloraceae cyanobacterium]